MAVREDLRDSMLASVAVAKDCPELGCSLQKQRLESLGLLSCGIAHDIRNLLTVIAGHVDLLLCALPDDHSLQQNVVAIANATEKLDLFSQQILNYAGGINSQNQPADLNLIVTDMSQLLNVVLPASTKVRLELSDPLPTLLSDPSQLAQLLLNLIMNASDAIGSQSGTISLATGVHASGSHLFLKVTDTGHGMSEQVMQNIFTPFFTTRTTGKGLGLAVVQKIVTDHGGFIKLHSSVGEGSSFMICLPMDTPASPPTQ